MSHNTYKQILIDLDKIHTEKQKAYGDSFSETMAEFGLVAALTRITDKTNRLKSLYKLGLEESGGESIKDTLRDLANYAIMTLAALECAENATGKA